MSISNYLKEFKFGFFLSSFLIVVSTSCEKTSNNQEVQVVDSKVFKELIINSKQSDLFIDSIKGCTGRIEIYFSNRQQITGYFPNVDLLSLGTDGYWYSFEEKTSSLSDSTSVEEMLCPQRGENGDLLAISEGYEDWTFHFKEEPSITIVKSLYAIDFDTILLSINHRGYNVEAPENTLPAFRLSRLKGFRYAETDIRFTSDGVPVLLHDASIERTSDGNGQICELNLSQVRQFDFGEWKSPIFKGTHIPTLEEFLSLCSIIGLHPVLELKVGNKDQVSKIIDLVESFGLEDETFYISFSDTILKEILKQRPYAKIAYVTSRITENTIKTALSLQNDSTRCIINAKDYSEEAIRLCEANNLQLWIWTVNSEETIKKVPSYVSAITSDLIHAGRLLDNYL